MPNPKHRGLMCVVGKAKHLCPDGKLTRTSWNDAWRRWPIHLVDSVYGAHRYVHRCTLQALLAAPDSV